MSKEKEILKEVGESPQYRLFEFFLQEHGITLLEGQMHDIIHEVQLYLDATNDKPVVKENLTPEEKARVKENLTSEERAREYAIKRHGTHIAFEPDRFESRVAYLEGYHSRDEEVKESYRKGLKQGTDMRDIEVEQLKEVLKIKDKEIKELREALGEAISLICQGTEYEVEVKPYVDFAAKAKQLLKDSKDE